MSSGILEIEPCRLQGKVNVPQSKSMAHRALIMAFLCEDISKVILDERNLSDDVIATREALEKKAVWLVGRKEVVQRKAKNEYAFSKDDLEYIKNNLK